jgi:hypothetical protein
VTGPDHYRLAEGYVEQARTLDDPAPLLAAAQVHATLALAAATALLGPVAAHTWDDPQDLADWAATAGDTS